jgi:hypothetical protein
MEAGLKARTLQDGAQVSDQRPPPAQAHAQPAQAQAQAHPLPPPREKELREVDGGGGGLVVFVTPLVNPTRLVTRFEAVVCTPFTTEAAKSEPGRVGSEILRPAPPEVDTGVVEGRGTLVEGR